MYALTKFLFQPKKKTERISNDLMKITKRHREGRTEAQIETLEGYQVYFRGAAEWCVRATKRPRRALGRRGPWCGSALTMLKAPEYTFRGPKGIGRLSRTTSSQEASCIQERGGPGATLHVLKGIQCPSTWRHPARCEEGEVPMDRAYNPNRPGLGGSIMDRRLCVGKGKTYATLTSIWSF